MNASVSVDDYIKGLGPEIQPIVARLHALILESSPRVKDELKFDIPFYTYQGWLCYINPSRKALEVTLGFCQGANLFDPEGHLQGKDKKQVRHLIFNSVEQVDESTIMELLFQALAFNEGK